MREGEVQKRLHTDWHSALNRTEKQVISSMATTTYHRLFLWPWIFLYCQALTVVLRRGHVHCKEEAGNDSPTGGVFDWNVVRSRNRRGMFVLVCPCSEIVGPGPRDV